jgi:hypothetical protein
VRLEALNQLKNPMTSDIPACSTVPQPTTLPHAPVTKRCTVFSEKVYMHLVKKIRGLREI